MMIHVFYRNRNTIGQFMVALIFLGTFGFLFTYDGFVAESTATSCCGGGEAAVTSFAADSSGDYGSDIPMDPESSDGCGGGTDSLSEASSGCQCVTGTTCSSCGTANACGGETKSGCGTNYVCKCQSRDKNCCDGYVCNDDKTDCNTSC